MRDVDSAMALLKKYNASFDRILPTNFTITKKSWDDPSRSLSDCYAFLPSSLSIYKLEKAITLRDYRNFKMWYPEAIDELDKYFLEIRAARKELFDSDTLQNPGIILEENDRHIDVEETSLTDILPITLGDYLDQYPWSKYPSYNCCRSQSLKAL
jgi:hypothetical protein